MPKKSLTKTTEAAKKTLYTITLTPKQMKALSSWCDRRAWAFYSVPYAEFAYKGPDVNVVAYQSGKVVIQGKGTEDFVYFVLEIEITGEALLGMDRVNHPEWFELHAGMDESGKGDFFGPLVAACVIADGSMVDYWLEKGLKESKKVSDVSALKLDKLIRNTPGVVVELTFANMERYNQLYDTFENLNYLLAWLHSKALEKALSVRWVDHGTLDQFTKARLVEKYLKNPKFKLTQHVRAEEDPVVAAASIVARAEYLRQIKQLSSRVGIPLPKGASGAVKEAAQKIIDKEGYVELRKFAKMHFKTALELKP